VKKGLFRPALLPTLLAALAALAAQPARAEGETQVERLRIGLNPERTRVVFDLSGAGPYRMLTLENPLRVVVDFPSGTSYFDPDSLGLAGTPVARIRTGIQPDGTLRYVFDLRREVEPELFPLQPFEGRGHRLVLDLHQPGAAPAGTAVAVAEDTAGATEGQAETLRAPPVITPRDATEVPNPVDSGTPGQWSGSVGVQTRLFFSDPAYPDQDEQNLSASFEPEYYIDWAGGTQRFAFRPFFRWDANDSERTHADVRELYWRAQRDALVFKAGVDVVFWGVTESQHLVDIINQTDRVENIDREDKLGQPMASLQWMTDTAGTWEGWVLPYFRERTFPGKDGRLRTDPPVDTDDPIWDSSDEEEHVDFALRWSHYIGNWDIGLAHFTGTGREPVLVPGGDPGKPTLRPFYQQIDQTSLDLQATVGAWLWKLEAIHNSNKIEDYYAAVGGFEYTLFGVANSTADLGWLLEYHHDERGEDPMVALQNDLYAGLRWTGNDIAGTRLLTGFTVDLDNGGTFGNVEAVRRLGESWTITLEARTFFNTDDDNPLHFFRDDDYIELQLDRFF